MIKLLVVDDHEIIRQGLRMLLKEETDIKVVGEAENGDDAIEKMNFLDFDIMVLDLLMPKKNGISLILDLKKIKPDLKILIFSISPENHYAIQALKSGASGYLNKGAPIEEVVAAIRAIHTRGRYISDKIAEQIALEIKTEKEFPVLESFTNREYLIITMIASGKKNREIAKDLSVSLTSVLRFKAQIFEKLKLHNDAELIQFVLQQKMVELPMLNATASY